MMNLTTYKQQLLQAGQKPSQHVSIGLVQEVMPYETRVAMTPATVREFSQIGHKVWFQTGAGAAAGYDDQMYVQAGATMMKNAQDVYQKCQIMIKVMQPMPQEYQYIQQQIIFCLMDLGNKDFIQNIMQRNAVVINFRDIQTNMNTFPVMNSMSEVAGFLAMQQGMRCMERQMGGSGMLLAQVAGVSAPRVLIVGGGVAAVRAATTASHMGAQVTLMDISLENMRRIRQQLPENVNAMFYTNDSLEKMLPTVDLLIGAALGHDSAPVLVSKNQMQMMRPMSVCVDLAMEYGGNFETSQMTTWEKPTFLWNNIIHFCVRNIVTCAPHAASAAFAHAMFPYALQVANMGWRRSAVECSDIIHGVVLAEKQITSGRHAKAMNLNYTSIESVLEQDIKKATQKAQNNGSWELKQQLSALSSNRADSSSSFFTIEA